MGPGMCLIFGHLWRRSKFFTLGVPERPFVCARCGKVKHP